MGYKFKIGDHVDVYDHLNNLVYESAEIIDYIPAKNKVPEYIRDLMMQFRWENGKEVRKAFSSIAYADTRYLVKVSDTLYWCLRTYLLNSATAYRRKISEEFKDLVAIMDGCKNYATASEVLPPNRKLRFDARIGQMYRSSGYRGINGLIVKMRDNESPEQFLRRLLAKIKPGVSLDCVPSFITPAPDTETLREPTGERRFWPLTVPSDNVITEEKFKVFQADIMAVYAKHGIEVSDNVKRQVGNYENIKAFVSMAPDKLRKSYSEREQALPRTVVMCETTNEPETFRSIEEFRKTEYLKTQMAITTAWFFEQRTRRHLIVANRLEAISSNS